MCPLYTPPQEMNLRQKSKAMNVAIAITVSFPLPITGFQSASATVTVPFVRDILGISEFPIIGHTSPILRSQREIH
ncbi:MAG: hypothetical protein FE78DRAFT_74498 [Acidomyces sp. 'richmondensis']|nr:MAG: hypothetical protein FE78DRAFT_74498 [Acidomyces sp. 'richmondensis']